jgi:excisionase family DNA binding protein
MDLQKLLLRPAEVGEMLGMSRAKVYNLIADGTIPSIRVGGNIRVSAQKLQEWVESQTQSGERHE